MLYLLEDGRRTPLAYTMPTPLTAGRAVVKFVFALTLLAPVRWRLVPHVF